MSENIGFQAQSSFHTSRNQKMMNNNKKNKLRHKKKKGNFENEDGSLRVLLQDEALVYCKMENYDKAIRQYTAALELSPNDKTALVSRSKCYLLLGQPRLALKDAEMALNEDGTYLKALYQKAEALYHLGDFEHSLVFYHRGLHVRPELEQFRLGVQKAREAIENAIGKMRNSALAVQQVGKGEAKRKGTAVAQPRVDGGDLRNRQMTANTTAASKRSTARRKDMAPAVAAATAKSQSKMLLRELCVDKDYLEHLTVDPNIVSVIQDSDNYILSEAKDGINFLNGREEFWKQQKLIN